MKKDDVIYFVEDAYGYLVSTDELGFFDILSIWKSYNLKYKITYDYKDNYTVKKLWRV